MMEIYFVAVSVLGFILGVGVMAFLDNKNLKDLMEENRVLRRKNVALKKALTKALTKAGKREVIEIIDNRTEPQPETYFNPF